jgi:hypothetical protein
MNMNGLIASPEAHIYDNFKDIYETRVKIKIYSTFEILLLFLGFALRFSQLACLLTTFSINNSINTAVINYPWTLTFISATFCKQ